MRKPQSWVRCSSASRMRSRRALSDSISIGSVIVSVHSPGSRNLAGKEDSRRQTAKRRPLPPGGAGSDFVFQGVQELLDGAAVRDVDLRGFDGGQQASDLLVEREQGPVQRVFLFVGHAILLFLLETVSLMRVPE